MVKLTVPTDLNKRFYLVYTNPFNYFIYKQIVQGNTYEPLLNSQLMFVPNYIPKWLDRPILYWNYVPKYF